MKKFNIEVMKKKPVVINGYKHYKGQITIGDFQESFYMPVDSWSIPEYKKQWKEGLERIKTHDSSCLVVNSIGYIEFWSLYREGEKIFIHNNCLFERPKGLPRFDINTCYLYVIPRETIDEDGNKISEWQVDLQDVLEYLKSEKKMQR